MFKNLETALLQPWPRIWLQEIDSTNAEACRRIARGELGPTWIAARSQTSGRGRRGREWLSETGNLFTTAYFPLERSPAFAGLVCFTTCISLRAALGELGVDVYFLRIEVELIEGQDAWDRFIDQIVQPRESQPSDLAEERLLLNPIGS